MVAIYVLHYVANEYLSAKSSGTANRFTPLSTPCRRSKFPPLALGSFLNCEMTCYMPQMAKSLSEWKMELGMAWKGG